MYDTFLDRSDREVMRKNLIFRIIYLVIIICLIGFIFSNSILSVEESSEASGRVLTWVNGLLEKINSPFLFSVVFVRKAAHFIEYFTLGALLSGYVILFKVCLPKRFVYCSFMSCLISMTDETIQYFSDRGSMLLDVWLDLFAASVGIFLIVLFNMRKIKIERV